MFSVIVPVYNHGPYLAEALLSAARSPLVTEVLVADDGSRDSSRLWLGMMRAALGPKFRDLTQDPVVNLGAHAQLNRLAAECRNPWVAVLNSDDRFIAGRFELIERQYKQEPFDLAFGDIQIFGEDGARLADKRGPFTPQYPFPRELDPARVDVLDLLSHQNFVATTSNIVFRKPLFEKIGGFADYRYVHDWDFVLRAALAGRVRYIPHFLTGYRIHSSNTIKEDSGRVDIEVKRLFARLTVDFPELALRPAFQAGMAANQYLRSRAHCPLAVVAPAENAWTGEVRARIAGVEVAASLDQVREGDYIYAPADPARVVPPEQLQNAVLGLAVQEADLLVISQSLAEAPNAGIGDLANHLVARHDVYRAVLAGQTGHKGRLVRLPHGKIEARPLPLATGQTLTVRNPPRVNFLLPAGRRTDKPLVFVFPALFAVGGAERQAIDMMRELRDRYDFVVISTERLAESQGSFRPAAGDAALAFFELAELAPFSLYMPMLERLKKTYGPSAVWILNGSTWLCDAAWEIRRLFADCGIADQRCYDDKVGWIERAGEPGVQACDRFIAVNQRIRKVFVERLGIPESKIDQIYSPVDPATLGPLELPAPEREAFARKYGLDEGYRWIAWVGRLTQQKRPLDFLELARRVRDSGDPTRFIMVGDGGMAAQCADFISKHKLGNVRRLDFCASLWELYSVVEGIIFTSEYEGLPIAMLQALAMGVPALATDVGDIELVLLQHRAGVVIPTINDMDTCFERYRVWAGGLDGWKRSARTAAPRVREQFASRTIADQYDRCFQAAMRAAGVNLG